VRQIGVGGLDHGYASMPEIDQVIDRAPTGDVVVDVHQRADALLQCGGDDVHAHELKSALLLLGHRKTQDDERVNFPARRERAEELAAVICIADVVEQDV